MQEAMMIYFEGEKNAGLFLAGAAAASLLAAILIFRWQFDLRSFAWTLGFFALAEIAIGVGLYLRTDPQVARLIAQLGADAARFYSGEGARMARVQRNFVIIEFIEVALIVVTATVAIMLKGRPVITGIALGILINAAFLLAFDLIAERRGAVYLAAIEVGR